MDFIGQNINSFFAIISGKLSAAINRKLYRSFHKEELDITPEQWSVLHSLKQKDGIAQHQLCVTTFKDRPTMTRILDNMQKQNLIKRTISENDRRLNIVNITEYGIELEAKASKIVSAVVSAAFSEFSDDDISEAGRLIEKAFGNFQNIMDD